MESEGKRHQPDSSRCDPASTEIADDHAHSRNAVHFPYERHGVAVSEVMEHLRAHHDIDRRVSEWQVQCVAAHGEIERGTARDG
jgi:hypothetical protein